MTQPEAETGCCDRLREDHRQTECQLSALAEALAADNLTAFEAGFRQLCDELIRHYVLEERALFPVLSMYRPMILMEVEHEDLQAAEQAVWQALASRQGAEIATVFQHFDERLRAHMREEDTGIFPLAETRPEPEEQALIARKLGEVAAELASLPDVSLLRPAPEWAVTRSVLFRPAERPIAMQTLFEAEHNSVQVIRLQAGQVLSPHWSAQFQCLLVLSGCVTLSLPERDEVLRAGDQIRLEPRLTFGVLAQEAAELLAVKVWPKPNYLRS